MPAQSTAKSYPTANIWRRTPWHVLVDQTLSMLAMRERSVRPTDPDLRNSARETRQMRGRLGGRGSDLDESLAQAGQGLDEDSCRRRVGLCLGDPRDDLGPN